MTVNPLSFGYTLQPSKAVRDPCWHLFHDVSIEGKQQRLGSYSPVPRHDVAQFSCLLQGHIRLALLPVVYNAMSTKETLRNTPLFIALEAALRNSTYYPLLQRQGKGGTPEPHAATAAVSTDAVASDTMWSESASPWYASFAAGLALLALHFFSFPSVSSL